MKAILEFDLPDDDEDFKHATNGATYYICMWEFYHDVLRKVLKYEDADATKVNYYQEITDKFFEILESRDVDLF